MLSLTLQPFSHLSGTRDQRRKPLNEVPICFCYTGQDISKLSIPPDVLPKQTAFFYVLPSSLISCFVNVGHPISSNNIGNPDSMEDTETKQMRTHMSRWDLFRERGLRSLHPVFTLLLFQASLTVMTTMTSIQMMTTRTTSQRGPRTLSWRTRDSCPSPRMSWSTSKQPSGCLAYSTD